MSPTPTHNFYVYGHYKPDGNIFYIGKGRDNRAWRQDGRSNFWYRTVQKHGTYHVVLLHEHLSEDEAFLKEKEEIAFWGRRKDGGFLINLTDGGEGASGYVLTADQLAKHTATMQKRHQDPAFRAKLKAAQQKRYQDPAARAQHSVTMQKRFQDPALRAKTKAAALKRYQDPALRAKTKAAMQTLAREFSVISPDGTLYLNIRNVREFCRIHGLLSSTMCAVLNGKQTHHKGWRMYTDGMPCVPYDFREFSVISPNGTLYLNQRNLSEFCKVHGLTSSTMCAVLKGKHNHHKGWKKYIPPSNNHLINQFL